MKMKKIVRRPKKRLGRGHGSGKVKTSGRGTKGQKARGTIPQGFEGGQLSLVKRLPFLRGRGRNRSRRPSTFALDITRLAVLPKGTTVTVETLKKHGILTPDVSRVKLVGKGQLPHNLTIAVPVSGGARAAIEKAGGTILQSA